MKYAYAATIGLNVVETTSAGDLAMYEVQGVCCSEVVLDLLTGSIQVCRVDILQEVGLSLNPLIDCGQANTFFLHPWRHIICIPFPEAGRRCFRHGPGLLA